MSQAAIKFFDFLHENKDNPRIIHHYDELIKLATAIHQAEDCGFVIVPDSVVEACERIIA